MKDNNVQVQAWYFTIHYKFLDVKVLRWITFRRCTVKVRNRRHDHRQNEASSATPLLASISTNLSSKGFFSLLVSNLRYDKSAN